MMIRWNGFNVYLLSALALAMVQMCGCRSPEGRRAKALSTFRVFLEANRDTSGAQPISVFRDNPQTVNIERESFLSEGNVSEARITEAVGGFALRIRLDRRGTWLLEQATVANHGKHMVIFSQFASPTLPKLNESRWLAAVLISNRISDGVLLFTADASREEAAQIVVGLNNAARKAGNTPGKQQ